MIIAKCYISCSYKHVAWPFFSFKRSTEFRLECLNTCSSYPWKKRACNSIHDLFFMNIAVLVTVRADDSFITSAKLFGHYGLFHWQRDSRKDTTRSGSRRQHFHSRVVPSTVTLCVLSLRPAIATLYMRIIVSSYL